MLAPPPWTVARATTRTHFRRPPRYRAASRHLDECAATPASSANARALKPDAAQRASSRLRISCSITCRPRTHTNALS
jgi:hypothetical protein